MLGRLTKREKFLIKLLVYILTAYVYLNFIIIPVTSTYKQNKQTLPDLQSKKDSMVLQINNIPNVEASIEELRLDLRQRDQNHIHTTPNHYVDNMITNLCLQYSLTPEALSISFSEEKDPQDNDIVSVVEVSADVMGEYRNLKNLITAVNEMRYITISSFESDFINEARSITFKVYMVDDKGIK